MAARSLETGRWSVARAVVAAGVALALAPASAEAWLVEGHRRLAADAVRALPREAPAFFRSGALAVGHSAVDPDSWKLHATPELRDGESPEHYLDWELLQGRSLPELRSEYLRLLDELDERADRVGLLPYAVLESWQRLVVAFAEHRAWPENRHVRAKTLVYAGLLSHYAGDVVQPLHTTIHFDGRSLPDGSSPASGVHRFVDGLLENAPFDRTAVRMGVRAAPLADVREAMMKEMTASHALVGRIYELEKVMEAAPEGEWPDEVVAFAAERYAAGARFLSSLYLAAWTASAEVEIPEWFPREGSRQRHAAPVGSGGR